MMLRESIPSQVDKKSRVSQEKKGFGALKVKIRVWSPQGGGTDKMISFFFFLKPSTDDYTLKQLSLNSV